MSLKKTILILGCLLFLIPAAFADNPWEIRRHTQRFEDHMTQGWYIRKDIDNVKVNNGNTTTGLGNIVFKFSAPDLMIFTVYDEGLDNPPKKFYKADYTYFTFSDDKGNEVNFAVETKNGNGNCIKGMEALAVRQMMVNSPYVKGSINVENMTYDFLMNTVDFRTKFSKLLKHLEYTDEEVERAIGHESAIFDNLFRKVCAQMNPYYKDSNKVNPKVNVREIRNTIDMMKELFPDYADNVLFDFWKISYAEWLSFFSMKYGEDITTLKNMDQVEEMYTLLTVEITPIDAMPMISHSPLIENLNMLDKLNGEKLTPEYEKPLPLSQMGKEIDGVITEGDTDSEEYLRQLEEQKEKERLEEEKRKREEEEKQRQIEMEKEIEERVQQELQLKIEQEEKRIQALILKEEQEKKAKEEQQKLLEQESKTPTPPTTPIVVEEEEKEEEMDIAEPPKQEEKKDKRRKDDKKEKPLKVESESEDDGLVYMRAKQERSNYLKFKSYGVGLTTEQRKELTNKVSFGGAMEITGFFDKHNGMTYGIGYMQDGTTGNIDQYLGYSARIQFNKKFEMVISPSVIFNMKSVPCVAVNKVLYGDKVTENTIGYLGARLDLGFNWFVAKRFFITFGVADRFVGPGFTLAERYKQLEPTKFSNTAEGYLGFGVSF